MISYSYNCPLNYTYTVYDYILFLFNHPFFTYTLYQWNYHHWEIVNNLSTYSTQTKMRYTTRIIVNVICWVCLRNFLFGQQKGRNFYDIFFTTAYPQERVKTAIL